ncbi:MAG TPA: hypothetical protein VMH92_08845 [Acidocella sp.]|nr:hypothetical protein [Acidocella sp.]
MNAPVHLAPGLWRHPRDRSTAFTKLSHGPEPAQLWERGLFDGVFLADVLGPYDVDGGAPDAAITHGTQLPAHDPLLLVPALQERGLYKTAYSPGTLREKLFGRGPRLAASHPARALGRLTPA